MILRVGWIFGPKTSTFLNSIFSVNSANFPGQSMVLSTKEAPKLAGLGEFEWKN